MARQEAICYGGSIAAERKAQKLSQSQLAAATRQIEKDSEHSDEPLESVAETTIAMLERDRRQPSANTLLVIARALNRPASAFGRLLADNEERCSHCDGNGYVTTVRRAA